MQNTLAAYLRDSGGEDQDLSIPQQEAELRAWASKNGCVITAWFKDEARRGSSTVGREGFQAMMAHFRDPACQEKGVLIWKMSRFSRDIDDSQFYRADLRRRGYQVISLNDNIPEGPEGRFFEAAIDWMNQRFLEDLSNDVKRGLKDLVLRWGCVPGTPPRGFKREAVQIGKRRDGREHIAHRWIPDPQLVPLVRQAFDMKLAGHSHQQINTATRLYGSLNSYTTFFINPLYKGVLEFGGLVVPDYCEPVVDPEVWQKVQVLMKKNARHQNLSGDNPAHPRREKSSYLLSGLAYCALCGSPLSGLTSRPKQGEPYGRYECTAARRRRDCTFKPVPQIFLEELVLRTVKDFVLEPGNLLACQLERQAVEGNRQAELDRERAEQRTLLSGVRRRIRNISNAIADAGHSRAMLQKLGDLELEEAEILARLAELERSSTIPQTPLSEEQIRESSERLAGLLASEDQQTVKAVLRGILHKVTIERQEDQILGRVEYYFPPTREPPEMDMSLSHAPLGAPIQRHTYSITLAVPLIRKKRHSG